MYEVEICERPGAITIRFVNTNEPDFVAWRDSVEYKALKKLIENCDDIILEECDKDHISHYQVYRGKVDFIDLLYTLTYVEGEG